MTSSPDAFGAFGVALWLSSSFILLWQKATVVTVSKKSILPAYRGNLKRIQCPSQKAAFSKLVRDYN